MKGAYIDNGTLFVADDVSARSTMDDRSSHDTGTILAGNSLENELDIRSVLSRSEILFGQTVLTIGPSNLTITTDGSASFAIGRNLCKMWEISDDPKAVASIDTLAAPFFEFKDIDWDAAIPEIGCMASDIWPEIEYLLKIINGNISDTTVKSLLCSRLCFYKSFRASMPDYIECMDPYEMAEMALDYMRKEVRS